MSLSITCEDLTTMDVDAIVIPAVPKNGHLSPHSNTFYEAAGREQLLEARRKLELHRDNEAGITPGFQLKARYIIHVKVPKWHNVLPNDAHKLARCYLTALESAESIGAASVAFPLLGAGANGCDLNLAKKIAENAINSFLEKKTSPDDEAASSTLSVRLVLLREAYHKLNLSYGIERLSYEEINCSLEKQYQAKFHQALSEDKLLSEDAFKADLITSILNEYIAAYGSLNSMANTIGCEASTVSRNLHRSSGQKTFSRTRLLQYAVAAQIPFEDRWFLMRCSKDYSKYGPYPATEVEKSVEQIEKKGIRDYDSINIELNKKGLDLSEKNKKAKEKAEM